jgi:hypothetical protein
MNRFIDHLQVVTTSNYNTIADFHTTNHSTLSLLSLLPQYLPGNSSPQWLFLCSVFTRRFLVTNLSNGDSSASFARRLTLHIWTLNCTVAPNVKIISRHRPCRKHSHYFWQGVFTAPLLSNGSYSIVACVFVAVGMCLPCRCLAMNVNFDVTISAFGWHVTIFIALTGHYSWARVLLEEKRCAFK